MTQKIEILIIESDIDAQERYKKFLSKSPLISNTWFATDTDQAILKIISDSPDMVLLEYPPKGKTGKDLIKFIKNKLTETTVILAADTKEYAADAIHLGIFNYLVKPLQKEEFLKIIEKVQLIKHTNQQSRIKQIIEKTQKETRLKFQTTKGYLIIDPDEILYCKADGFCTEIYLTNNRVELSYLFLSKLDEILKQFDFLRVSRSYLINQKYIRKIYRSSNTIVLSCDGKEHEVKGSKIHIKNLSKFDTE